MRKILFLLPPMVLALVVGMLTSCRFAASYNDGDTIAASEFEPADTSLVSKRQVKDTLNHVAQNIVDSTDIFYVGTGLQDSSCSLFRIRPNATRLYMVRHCISR